MALWLMQPIGKVSIHAPARGATRLVTSDNSIRTSFNPRAREGRDNNQFNTFYYFICFNPRAREGRDLT